MNGIISNIRELMILLFTPEEGVVAAEADVVAFVDKHLISEILRVKCTIGKTTCAYGPDRKAGARAWHGVKI